MKIVPNINELKNNMSTFESEKEIQMIKKTRPPYLRMFETIIFGRTHSNKKNKRKKLRNKNTEAQNLNKRNKNHRI